jgi:DNA-directed RNA polymerase subunit RPC12/RpoP
MVTGMEAKTEFKGAPTPQPASNAGEGSAGIVSEQKKKYVRSTCLRCWQKVVIAWKKGDYLKNKKCPLCGGRLLGKILVKKGDPDYPVLDADATQAAAGV